MRVGAFNKIGAISTAYVAPVVVVEPIVAETVTVVPETKSKTMLYLLGAGAVVLYLALR